MLKGIFKFVAFLALMLIAVDSGWGLWKRVIPDYELLILGIDPTAPRGVLVGDEKTASQFDTTEPINVEMSYGRVTDEETGLTSSRPLYSIIPVYVQNVGKVLPKDFIGNFRDRVASLQHHKRRVNGLPLRSCPAKYGSDILVRFHRSNETLSVFDGARVAITQYSKEFSYEEDAGYLVIQYAKDDSDNDGELTCNDHQSFAVYDLVDRKLMQFDLDGGEPVWEGDRYLQGTRIIGVGVDENGDGWHDRTRERVRIAYFDYETKSLDYLTP